MVTKTTSQEIADFKPIPIKASERTVNSVGEGAELAAKSGNKIATLLQVIMNKSFMEEQRGKILVVDSNDAPKTKGWHKINRETGALTPITDIGAGKLEWHEGMFIPDSAANAIKEGRLLVLEVGVSGRNGLCVYSELWYGYDAQVGRVVLERDDKAYEGMDNTIPITAESHADFRKKSIAEYWERMKESRLLRGE